VKHAGTGDEFPRRLCDPLPPVTAVLYYHWLAAGLYDKIITQGVGGLRVYVGIRHPAGTGSFCRIRIDLLVCTTADVFCCCCYIPQGMTNRRDLIDDALLRPGRLEVQVEIGKNFVNVNPKE